MQQNMNNLLKLISGGENECLEFKESLWLKEEIGQTVSAFSNANGGLILAGVSNDGKVIGVDIGRNTKKTATRDLQELVGLGILIKSGRTDRGVHYVLNQTYKGDIRGHEI